MKFRVTFKSPDALPEAIRGITSNLDLPAVSPWGDVPDKRAISDEIYLFTGKWIRSGEYITVEFDTDKGTCEVVAR